MLRALIPPGARGRSNHQGPGGRARRGRRPTTVRNPRVIEAGADHLSAADERPRLFHVIDPRVFDRQLLDELCELATRVRRIAKSREGELFLQSLLPTRRAMLYFTQPSTRTFLSFNNACHILGIRTSEIRDPSTSSEVKGERFED